MESERVITAENLRKAHDEGCSDVKRVLETLFPEFDFTAKLRWPEGYKYYGAFQMRGVDGTFVRIELLNLPELNIWIYESREYPQGYRFAPHCELNNELWDDIPIWVSKHRFI